jgi:predicted porin
MNKKLMAAAVAGVLVAPAAFAQSSNVQLYGRINGGVDYYKATGATNLGVNAPNGSNLDRDGRFRVFDNSSRVGLRGTEDLGGGLKAIFQIETGVNIDNGSGGQVGQGGQANTSTGFWGTRDTYGGLQANWGRVTYGRQSMYWANGVNAQFAANYINTEIPWTNGTNLGRVSGGGIVAARVSNTLQYTSPTWAGNNFTVSYVPRAEAVQNTGASTDTDGYIFALTWRGTFGPVYGQIDWASVNANSNLATNTQQKGNLYKAGVSWGYMPGARVGVIWVRTEQNGATGLVAGNKVKKDGYTLNWEHTFGNIQAMAQYGWTGDIKDCALANATVCGDSSATAFIVGGRYLLSKRTWLYLSYNQVSNKGQDFIDYTGGGQTSTSGAPTPYGADPRIFALGFFHHF